MNILIVNDDGILEPGLKVLAEQLASLGDIYIVAPERPIKVVKGMALPSINHYM